MRMEPLKALEIVEQALQQRGYHTKRSVEEGDYVLEVSSFNKKARIRFHQQKGELIELRLKYEGTAGLTILKCEQYEKSLSCIEDLLNRF
ncbi:hypothetical protein [Infirmifilum sp.]|uniref:hypothetical protein n=1 Tax=Infirmifilum sp. TaxID=2856575 RepID=UPI003D09C324